LYKNHRDRLKRFTVIHIGWCRLFRCTVYARCMWVECVLTAAAEQKVRCNSARRHNEAASFITVIRKHTSFLVARSFLSRHLYRALTRCLLTAKDVRHFHHLWRTQRESQRIQCGVGLRGVPTQNGDSGHCLTHRKSRTLILIMCILLHSEPAEERRQNTADHSWGIINHKQTTASGLTFNPFKSSDAKWLDFKALKAIVV